MNILAKAQIATVLVLSAAGCGSGTPIVPIAASGFASAGDEVAALGTFARPATPIYSQTGSVGDVGPQDLAVAIDKDGVPSVTYNGVTYALTEEDSGVYSTSQDDTAVLYLRSSVTAPAVAETIYLSFETEDTFDAGFVVIGYDTNPASVTGLTGSATFEGDAILSARQVVNGTLRSGFSSGTANVTADFEDNRVSGTLRFDTQQNRPITLDDVTLQLKGAPIIGNRFQGAVSVSEGGFGEGRGLDGASVDGQFFGDTAQAVGGTITGTLSTDAAGGLIHLQGAFLGSQ